MDNSLTYYTVASVIEAFILWLYCNKLFKQRLNTPLSILIAIIMHLLSAPVYMLHFPILNIISFLGGEKYNLKIEIFCIKGLM